MGAAFLHSDDSDLVALREQRVNLASERPRAHMLLAMWRVLPILLVLAAGCSFLGARHWQAKSKPDCSMPVFSTAFDGAVATFATVGAVESGTEPCSGESCIGTGLNALARGTIAGVALLSALYGGYELHACRQRREQLGPDPSALPEASIAPPPAVPVPADDGSLVEVVQARSPAAAQLTRQAHEAALRHQCGGATALQDRVRDIDPEYYAKVFVVDPPIAACLR